MVTKKDLLKAYELTMELAVKSPGWHRRACDFCEKMITFLPDEPEQECKHEWDTYICEGTKHGQISVMDAIEYCHKCQMTKPKFSQQCELHDKDYRRGLERAAEIIKKERNVMKCGKCDGAKELEHALFCVLHTRCLEAINVEIKEAK